MSLRSTEFWTRTLPKGLRGPARIYVDWLRRRVRRAADESAWQPIDAIEVVTGGSIAHIYFDRGARARLTLEEIDARYPELIAALERCPAVGLMVARGADGPIVMYRGGRWRLGESARARAARAVPPARLRAGRHAPLARRGRRALRRPRALRRVRARRATSRSTSSSARTAASAPDELDQFVLHPAHIALPAAFHDGGSVAAEEFYRFFSERYGGHDGEERPAQDAA